MIFLAVAGPTPGSETICASLAVLRSTKPVHPLEPPATGVRGGCVRPPAVAAGETAVDTSAARASAQGSVARNAGRGRMATVLLPGWTNPDRTTDPHGQHKERLGALSGPSRPGTMRGRALRALAGGPHGHPG